MNKGETRDEQGRTGISEEEVIPVYSSQTTTGGLKAQQVPKQDALWGLDAVQRIYPPAKKVMRKGMVQSMVMPWSRATGT